MKVRPCKNMKQNPPSEKRIRYKGFLLASVHLHRLLEILELRRSLDESMTTPAMGKFTR